MTWSASDPTSLLDVEHLEIDPTKVPSGRLLFRARSLKSLFLLRADFALDLERAGFTGAGWLESSRWSTARFASATHPQLRFEAEIARGTHGVVVEPTP